MHTGCKRFMVHESTSQHAHKKTETKAANPLAVGSTFCNNQQPKGEKGSTSAVISHSKQSGRSIPSPPK